MHRVSFFVRCLVLLACHQLSAEPVGNQASFLVFFVLLPFLKAFLRIFENLSDNRPIPLRFL